MTHVGKVRKRVEQRFVNKEKGHQNYLQMNKNQVWNPLSFYQKQIWQNMTINIHRYWQMVYEIEGTNGHDDDFSKNKEIFDFTS